MTDDVLARLETYYDTAPRANARTEEVGPFTLFVKSAPDGFDYYARPRLGHTGDIAASDVDTVRYRQRRLGVPENLEWVHDTSPSLLDAALTSGLVVEEAPLLVLGTPAAVPSGPDVRVLDPDADDLGQVLGVVHAGFAGSDEVEPRDTERARRMMRAGLRAVAAAYDGRGHPVGGGSHGPRGTTTELAGIAVLPRARRQGLGTALTAALVQDALVRGLTTVFLAAQDDAVARVYERVGFVRVGTACVAEAPAP